MTATAATEVETCPEWCAQHVTDGDWGYHRSRDKVVHGHTICVTGERLGADGWTGEESGIYFFTDGFPSRGSTVSEATAELEALTAEIRRKVEIAEALADAIDILRGQEQSK